MKKKTEDQLTEVRGVSLPHSFWLVLSTEASRKKTTVSALVRESVRTHLKIQEVKER